MSNVPKKIIHYYVKIKSRGFAYKKCARPMLANRYMSAKNHKRLGYVFEVYLDELEEIKKTKNLHLQCGRIMIHIISQMILKLQIL